MNNNNNNNHRRLQQQPPRRPVIHVSPDEVALRVVCHASVIGGIIGANGYIVSKLRRETATKIHCQSPVPGSDHWVVFIVGSNTVDKTVLLTDRVGDVSNSGGNENEECWVTCQVSCVQTALVRVLERSWAVCGDDDEEACCGVLADKNQIGAVLGLGGKNVEWMRRNSGAMIRVLPSPSCGTSTDELVQITGDVLAVKKALVMVSTCLQNCPPHNGYPPPLCVKVATNGNLEDPHSEFFPNLRVSSVTNGSQAASDRHLPAPYDEGNESKETERKVVFKIICTSFAAGGIIGKQGTIIRRLQNETGASIRIGDPLKVSGERVVTISALENLESRYSHAQNGLALVYERSVEIDVEKGLLSGLHDGASVKAKLVVPSQFANGLIGKREAIVTTGVDISIPVGNQIMDHTSENELVIEIKGEYRHVQKALSNVAFKLRENLLPKEVLEEMRARLSNPYESSEASQNRSLQPSQQNGSRSESLSVSDVELDKKMVRKGAEIMKSLMHNETLKDVDEGFICSPSLVENDLTQGMKQLQLSSNHGVSLRNISLELAFKKDALRLVYGRDGFGIDNLQQISGAKVNIKDRTGVEVTVLISGTSEETHTAISLITSILADQ